jgi:N-acetylmuramoyl-L-alanine amidase
MREVSADGGSSLMPKRGTANSWCLLGGPLCQYEAVRWIALLAIASASLLPSVAHAGDAPVVVIDPGHDGTANLDQEPIGPDASEMKIKDGGGTRGVVTGLSEAELNMQISRRVRRLLERAGVNVVMTRTKTEGVSIGNVARAQIANRAGAALFLRIHADGASDSSVHGTHTLVPALRDGWTDDIYGASARAGRLVQRALVTRLGSSDRGIQERSDFTGFNWSDVPAILVEVGYMTNPAEDRALSTPGYQRRAALGLCEGTLRFLRLSPSRCAGGLSP